MTSTIDTPTVGLGELISTNTFSVPLHQRDYSWDEDYVNQFLDDIDKAQEEGRSEYFFGLMVFTRDSAKARLSVIDGQQRLATAIMLYSAVRNWVSIDPEQKHFADQITSGYISAAKLGAKVGKDRLMLNATNQDHFHRFVLQAARLEDVVKENERTKKADRNKRLLEATIRTVEWVNDKAKSFNSPAYAVTYFIDLLEYLNRSVRVVSMVPGNDED